MLARAWNHVALMAGAAVVLAVAAAPAGAAARPGPAHGSAMLKPGAHARRPAGAATVDGLVVSVGYAEDKETNTPDPAAFPVPWVGARNTTFLGAPVPGGQTACGALTVCYDAGAIRLDNPTASPVTVSKTVVNIHGSVKGGKIFSNLWGPFTVQPGKSVILTENPPHAHDNFDDFDTSGYPPNNCTPITAAPQIILTIAGNATTLADSTHVLDTGGTDRGYCPPKQNESIQWRRIGAAGGNDGSLTLGPATATAPVGKRVIETATLLDGSGFGLPNVRVQFAVTSGPDDGATAAAVTNSSGQATFAVPGAGQGEDVVTASVQTVGTIQSGESRVMWTGGSAAEWNATDVGNPALTGSQSFNSGTGTWTVSGGGSGLSGASDQFHYASQPAAGGVAARVTAQTASGPAAQAGVMIRASTDPGAPYYGALVTPSGTVTVQDRASPDGGTADLASTSVTGPAYLWVTGNDGSYTAYESGDGYDWTPIPGSTVSLNLGSGALAGLAVTSADPAVLNTATIDGVALPAGPPAPALPEPCPAPWNCADIGSPVPAGSQSFDPNTATWTIDAGGADITGTSDQFRYIWQTLTGDGSVIADVASQTGTSPGAKAGVMVRASTDPAAPNYALVVSPGQGIKVQVRKTTGATTSKLASPTGTTPAWVKITRSGDTFTAYTSGDGVTWTLIPGSSTTVNLGPGLLAGLAVTSHNSGALCTVTMTGVRVG